MTVPHISVPLPVVKIVAAVSTALPVFAFINWASDHRPLISDFEQGGLIGYCLCVLNDWMLSIKAKP